MAGIGLTERFRAFIRDKFRTTSRNVDMYLSEHLPDYITEYDLATVGDLSDIDEEFNRLDAKVGELEAWRGETSVRIDNVRHRIELLETKYIK